jgi:oligoribonuclease NrnB/cAMP/cGMP phosphodiesterase (DHH superfamily)
MNKTTFNYVIFHRGCLDGFGGFFVAHMSGRLVKDVQIYPDVPSTNNVPPDIDGKDMLIIDVAYKKQVLEQIFKYARSVVFIDHHVSIYMDTLDLAKQYNRSDNIEYVYDVDRCGTTLTWKYLNGRQQPPAFLKYIEDQDTGTWQYKETKPFIFALKAYYHLSTENKSLQKWFRLMNQDIVDKMIKRGKYMAKYNTHLVNINVPRHTLERFPSTAILRMAPHLFQKAGQYVCAVYCGLNCPSVTDLAVSALGQLKCDFCIMWTYNLDSKKYILSMRSRVVDVSAICAIFGGGGHGLAAACSFAASDYSIGDLFEGNSLPRTYSMMAKK